MNDAAVLLPGLYFMDIIYRDTSGIRYADVTFVAHGLFAVYACKRFAGDSP
jgi:hypothetical protein